MEKNKVLNVVGVQREKIGIDVIFTKKEEKK